MSLKVICGSMFSGKIEELVRRIKRCLIAKKGCVVFKHSVDNRYHESDVVSHNGTSVNAYPVSTTEQICNIWNEKNRDNGMSEIFFDEVQFINDSSFVDLFKYFVKCGINVTVAGLDTTFQGNAFPGIMGDLLCLADEITKLKAVCVVCGEDACRSNLIYESGVNSGCVKIGGSESYTAVCKLHFTSHINPVEEIQGLFAKSLSL